MHTYDSLNFPLTERTRNGPKDVPFQTANEPTIFNENKQAPTPTFTSCLQNASQGTSSKGRARAGKHSRAALLKMAEQCEFWSVETDHILQGFPLKSCPQRRVKSFWERTQPMNVNGNRARHISSKKRQTRELPWELEHSNNGEYWLDKWGLARVLMKTSHTPLLNIPQSQNMPLCNVTKFMKRQGPGAPTRQVKAGGGAS